MPAVNRIAFDLGETLVDETENWGRWAPVPYIATLPVDVRATSAEWGVAKPSPEFFTRMTRELDAPPDRIAYVGDRIDIDVLPARRAGMVAMHVRRGPWGRVQAAWPEALQSGMG